MLFFSSISVWRFECHKWSPCWAVFDQLLSCLCSFPCHFILLIPQIAEQVACQKLNGSWKALKCPSGFISIFARSLCWAEPGKYSHKKKKIWENTIDSTNLVFNKLETILKLRVTFYSGLFVWCGYSLIMSIYIFYFWHRKYEVWNWILVLFSAWSLLDQMH